MDKIILGAAILMTACGGSIKNNAAGRWLLSMSLMVIYGLLIYKVW